MGVWHSLHHHHVSGVSTVLIMATVMSVFLAQSEHPGSIVACMGGLWRCAYPLCFVLFDAGWGDGH
jgi:hypothetical protein